MSNNDFRPYRSIKEKHTNIIKKDKIDIKMMGITIKLSNSVLPIPEKI
jgi:hypothetical protein